MMIVVILGIFVVLCPIAATSREVTCSCGVKPDGDDVTERGLPGPPGKRGATGLQGVKGDQGLKGEKGQAEKTKDDLQKLQNKLLALENKLKTKDCSDVAKQGHTTNGIYTIFAKGKFIDVYCELESGNENWLVFQRRNSGKTDFYLDWLAYRSGFGNMYGEFWLGLENLHVITSADSYKLRIDLEDWKGNTAYAEYSTITVGDASTNYRLNIRSYSGTAGDSMTSSNNNRPFTTKDNDHDSWRRGNCATDRRGAWWFGECSHSGLNGEYFNGGRAKTYKGIHWYHWKGATYSMKKTEMKVRRI